VTSDPRVRHHRSTVRDEALRRIARWTAALAVGGVIGSLGVAAVARADTQGAATGSTSSSGGGGAVQVDPGGGDGSSGGLQPPQDVPVPQLQDAPPVGTSGGS
jgi:hypothetical protein